MVTMKDITITIENEDNDVDIFDALDESDEAKPLPCRVAHTGVMVRDTLTNISYIRPDGNVSDAVIVVIPGNPGAIGFYDKFIEHLYQIYEIPIYGVSYAGHDLIRSESVEALQFRQENHPENENHKTRIYSLEQQIAHKLSFIRNHLEPGKKIILIAHSIGCYIALNILKKQEIADRISLAIMLFPVIERTMETPCGKFWVPLTQTLCGPTASIAERLPESTKEKIADVAASRRKISRHSRRSFSHGVQPLFSASGLKNMTRIAKDLSKIGRISGSFKGAIKTNKDKLVFYYGANDDWAPLSFYKEMKVNFPDVDIRLDGRCVEHAFVFRSSHIVSKVVADIIAEKSPRMSLDLPSKLSFGKRRFQMARAQRYKHYSDRDLTRISENFEFLLEN